MTQSFFRQDLTGATFERVYLRGASFTEVDFTGARLRNVLLADVEISGDIEGVTVNGVDIGPLIEAELDRRHPERVKLRPTTADGFREAWPVVEDCWARTVERARRLEPELLHEQVAGEWSFIQTLRHLVFATDSWVRRALLGDPSPWDPLDLPWDSMPPTEGVPWDREARPSLDDVLALRADRMATVADVIASLTDEQLASTTEPVPGPGWPRAEAFPVSQVLTIVLNEEFWHHVYANRDLAALEAGGPVA